MIHGPLPVCSLSMGAGHDDFMPIQPFGRLCGSLGGARKRVVRPPSGSRTWLGSIAQPGPGAAETGPALSAG